MYLFTNHIKLKFNGYLNRTFYFDLRYTENEMYNTEIPNKDLNNNLKVDEDGYLYIQGCRITNNKRGIGKIYGSLYPSSEDKYLDIDLSIDSSGEVVVVKKTRAENQVSRFLSKLLG